jgi:hypothetical protein
MEIEISPRNVLVILLSGIGFLVLANLFGIVLKYGLGHDSFYGLVELFDFNRENNIPTLYSTLQLIIASLLASIIAVTHKSNGANYMPWLAIAVIFLFLAIDETAQIHEKLVDPVRMAFGLTGLLYFAWVVPYGIGVLLLVFAFSRFLYRLPRKSMRRFMVSGMIYVTGAIGLEMLGARHYESYGGSNFVYSMIYTGEELLEMLGVAFFIYALLAYVANEFQHLRATIRN